MEYSTPIGGGLLGASGTFGGYGGLLGAMIGHYGRNMQAPPVDHSADADMARLLGLKGAPSVAETPSPLGMLPYEQTGEQPLPDPPDFTDRYNTALGRGDEPKFKAWMAQLSKVKGYDAAMDLADYDLRGAFKSGATADGRGHFTDEYKKPNHPTFSDESIYNGRDGYQGGQWVDQGKDQWSYQASPTNTQFRTPAALKDYFQQAEPGVSVTFPQRRTVTASR